MVQPIFTALVVLLTIPANIALGGDPNTSGKCTALASGVTPIPNCGIQTSDTACYACYPGFYLNGDSTVCVANPTTVDTGMKTSCGSYVLTGGSSNPKCVTCYGFLPQTGGDFGTALIT